MAKKKRAPIYVRPPRAPSPPPDLDDDDDDDEPEGDELPPRLAVGAGDEVEQMLEQLGAQVSAARIIVHRITANQDPEECIDCPLPTFSKDRLREQFGAGVYSCEVRHKGTIKRRWQWRFAAPLAPAPGAPVDSRADRLEAELRAEREKAQDRQHQLVMALLQRPQAETSAPSLGDLLETLTSAKALLGGGTAAASPIAQLKELLEVRDLIGGDGPGKGASGMDLALEALKSLPQLIQAGADTPRPRGRLAAPGAGTSPGHAAVTSDADKRNVMLGLLLEHAKQGTDPAAVAQVIYTKLCELEQAQFDAACEFVDGEGALSLAMMFEPRLQPARTWLEQVLDQLRAAISQGDGEASLQPEA